MGKILVLAEKPSVGKEIARVLGCKQKANGFIAGNKYIVTWALGHLVTLADPEVYGDQYKTWSLETLPMLPKKMKLVTIKETSKQYKVVQSLMQRSDVSEIIIATDSGREGELVARWIMAKAHCNKPAKRLWISSQTDKAIKEGFANLKPSKEYDNLYRSAQSRAEADWLVGLNITRALTCKHNAQLSAGRVQTPTLALIVEREEEIRRFVPKDYWTVTASFKGFTAQWKDIKGQSAINQQARAEEICQAVRGKDGIITELKKEFKHEAPPAAYDLTELQRDANKKYAYSAKQTLQYMQNLYERHKLLTYPRTDSRYISDDVVSTIPERLKSIAVGPYAEKARELLRKPLSTRFIVNNAKVTDHHAIIPTEQYVDFSALSPEEKNIYDLVVRRFLAVLSAPYEYEQVKVKVQVGKEQFHAKGKVVKNIGWKGAYASSFGDDKSSDEQALPVLSQNERVRVLSVNAKSAKTKPPARYTEATLLTAMENPVKQVSDVALKNVLQNTSGLGTPATRADIIEKILNSFYVERRGKELVPTSKGIQLIKIVPEDLRSAELTAKWEQKLEQIKKGTLRDTVFVGDMQKYASSLVGKVIASDAKYVHDNITTEKCPDCGKFLLNVKGKNGTMLICSDRECGYRKSLSKVTNARCPNCHKKLELRGESGKEIFTCICGFREKLSEFEKRKSESGARKNEVAKYMQSQKQENFTNSALADKLKQWQEMNK